MSDPDIVSRPCFSMRLVRPFLKVLREYPGISPEIIDPLEAMDPEDRLPADTMHELLRGAVVLTGDPYIGLKAARAVELGEYGVLEYVAGSAPTVRGAIEVVGRYLKLVNDAMVFELEVDGPTAILRLHSSIPEPATAEAFGVAAFYLTITARADERDDSGTEVCFRHAEPEDISEYQRAFGDLPIHFGAPFTGFRFPSALLDLPLPSGDPALHGVLRKHAEQLLAELPRVETFVDRVRHLIMNELSGGNPSSVHVAELLAVSPRTLTRRLEQEGTSFKAELDGLRHGLATRYATQTDMQLSEIALLLGFSNAASFHRAFKRWTGETPLDYRRARRG